MGEWSNLTQREKSNIIRFAIKNGVSDINTIRDTFNVYAKDSLANVDYNMAAAKASGFGSNGNGHYPDTFKKPNHPTFSDESIYHLEATPGGKWRGNTYEPSEFVFNQQGDWNNFLKGFYSQEQGTGAIPVFKGGIMLPEVTITPQYKEGGKIYIKPSKRGTFTAAATKHGKSVQEFARQVLAHKENYSSAMVKKANFARNFGGHYHEDGGYNWKTQAIAKEQEMIEGQKQWLRNWYAKRLPAIGKEHLQEYVDAGLGVPYKTTLESPTPSSPSMGANYHFSNDDYRNPSTIKEKGYDTGTGIYFYTYRPIGMLGFKQEKYSTPVHEFTHATQYGGSSIFNPEFTGGKNIGEFDDYLQRPDEQHARIMELRYENKLDPTKTDYTAEDIKNLKDPSGALQELRSGGMDDDAIINALNTWASSTESAFDLRNGKHISSTGGPLYPFSFQKNPYWKTPVVRYDSGGILGHQYGIGDFLSKLFAPTYSGDFSTAFASARNDGNSYFKWNGDRYSTQWETEKYREEHPEEYVPEFAYTDAMNRIVREENVKLVKNGYIPELNAWQPHKSVEGGAKTIGYGLKLGPHNQAVLDELERNKSDKYPNGYISDAFALQQSVNLLRDEYEPLAKKYWNSTFKDDSWDNLSPKMKSIILDYQYNVRGGIKAFPKLMRAIHDKDYDGIKANYKRYDDKKRELGRNKGIYQDLERLFGGYYSVYNN